MLAQPPCGVGSGEGVMVAECLERHGIVPQETARSGGLLRFQPFNLDFFVANNGQWRDLRCCARDAVTFHDVSPLYIMELWAALYPCRAGDDSGLEIVQQ